MQPTARAVGSTAKNDSAPAGRKIRLRHSLDRVLKRTLSELDKKVRNKVTPRRNSLSILSNICRIPRPSATMDLPRKPPQPRQLHPKLLDGQLDHPDGFVETMAHLFSNRPQRGLFPSQFLLQEFP